LLRPGQECHKTQTRRNRPNQVEDQCKFQGVGGHSRVEDEDGWRAKGPGVLVGQVV